MSAADLVLPNPSEGSAEVRARVAAARTKAEARLIAIGARGMRTNAETSGAVLEQVANLDGPSMDLLRTASETLRLSARGFHRTLKVARTLADLDGQDGVGRMHVAEALSYRGETFRQKVAS